MRKQTYRTLWLIFVIFISACSTFRPISPLPPQPAASRLFKVVQLDEQRQIRQTSLLALQSAPEQWRWVQTDSLGAPIARLVLTGQGWQNDGFIMPNHQAERLYSALATALNPDTPLFHSDKTEHLNGSTDYYIAGQKVWSIKPEGGMINIILDDNSIWQIEALPQ